MGKAANQRLHARHSERERRRKLVKNDRLESAFFKRQLEYVSGTYGESPLKKLSSTIQRFNLYWEAAAELTHFSPTPNDQADAAIYAYNHLYSVSTREGVLATIHTRVPGVRCELAVGRGVVVVAVIQNAYFGMWLDEIRSALHDSLSAGVASYIFEGPVWRWPPQVLAQLNLPATHSVGFEPDNGAFTILRRTSEDGLLSLWGHLERRLQWLAANLSPGRGKRKRRLYELWMKRVSDELTRRQSL